MGDEKEVGDSLCCGGVTQKCAVTVCGMKTSVTSQLRSSLSPEERERKLTSQFRSDVTKLSTTGHKLSHAKHTPRERKKNVNKESGQVNSTSLE